MTLVVIGAVLVACAVTVPHHASIAEGGAMTEIIDLGAQVALVAVLVSEAAFAATVLALLAIGRRGRLLK